METARSTFRGCHAFFEETFLAVCLPKVIVVQNNRLGFILRMLQAATLGTLVAWGYASDLWMTLESPSSYQQSLWFEPAVTGHYWRSSHCLSPKTYWFNISGSFVFQPTGCRHLPTQAAYYDTATNRHGDTGVFFPTFVRDETTWEGSSCTIGNNACVGAAATGDCPCTLTEQYFTSNPEHQRLRLFHGFEVVPTHKKGWAMRGTSRNPYITEGYLSGDHTVKGELLTIIRREDGSPCNVGGRSEWTAEIGTSGIVGTLQEWLHCGGINIDSDPRTKLSEGERVVSGLPSHLRTMGFAVQLLMEYTNRRHDLPNHDGVVCFLKVRIRPTWMLRKSTDTMRIGNESAAHTRISTGVVVNLEVQGSFAFFELRKAVSAVAESMVLLQIPIVIVRFIALYGMGFISGMYRRAYRTSVNIYKEFHTTCARMMVMEVGFRGLLGGVWEGHLGDTGLTIDNVFEHLKDIFHEAIDNGDLNGADLKRLVALMFADLDHDDTGCIACSEFINSCMMHDCVNVQDMVRFFNTQHQGGYMTRFLDDATKHSNRKLQKLNTSERLSSMTDGRRASLGGTPGIIHIEELPYGADTDEFQGVANEDGGDSEGTSLPSSRSLPAATKVAQVPADSAGIDANQDALTSGRSSLAERAMSRPVAGRPPESAELPKASTQLAHSSGVTDGSELPSTEASDLMSRIIALECSQVEMARRFEKIEIRDMEHRLAAWKDKDHKASVNRCGYPGSDDIQSEQESILEICSNQSLQKKSANMKLVVNDEHISPAQPRPSTPGQGMHAYLRELEALVTGLRGGDSSTRQPMVEDDGNFGGSSGSSTEPKPSIREQTTSMQDQLELQALKAELLLTSTKTVDLCKKIHDVFRTMESRVGPMKDVTHLGDSTCVGHGRAASSSGCSTWQAHMYSASSAGHEGSVFSCSSSMRERLQQQRREVDLH